ncbi:MAG: hypothetical protein J6U73_08235 [Alistipes sp.]|nr:hypothetical protein [Alistipes sp.]
MKRLFLLLAVIALCESSIYATDSIPTPRSRFGWDCELSGNIAKIDYILFSYSVDKQTNQIYKTHFGGFRYIFNKRGDVVKQISMGDGSTAIKYSYRQTRDKFIAKIIDGCSGITLQKYLYNKQNQLVKERFYGDSYKYFYDAKGNIKEERFKDEKTIYDYDDKCNVKEICYYNSDNELCGKDTYTYAYNDQASIIEKCEYDINNRLRHKDTYNELGKLTESLMYDSDGKLVYKYTYSYDENGVLIEKYCYYKERLIKCTYDDNGNIIKELNYDLTGYLRGTTEYEYDTLNNLILKKETYEKEPGHDEVEILCYDIEYCK